MRLLKNLKARILESIIAWSEMGKQTAQAKEVYSGSNRTSNFKIGQAIIIIIVISLTKFTIVIGSAHTYLSRNQRAITSVQLQASDSNFL